MSAVIGHKAGVSSRPVERSAIPTATYRLQLHKGFTLIDAAERVTYFKTLGISHLYLSPVQVARAGSMHGYDVIDHRAINPELGGEAALRHLGDSCAENGMGLILDIVPNHMAVGGADNAMWLDVLENGAASRYATVFDIDFNGGDTVGSGKVVVPVLGEPYGEALTDGKLCLIWDDALGKLAFAYGPHRFPLRLVDYAEVTKGDPAESADLSSWQEQEVLHQLLERQNFRLTWWSAAGDIINWRRFFDVNELAGLRMEDEAVFRLTHDIILRLYAEGVIDGVRVDHVDGLADPAAYLKRLRLNLDERTCQRPADAPRDGPYIVVEKILGSGESLCQEWAINGTTGYDFMNQVSALQHDGGGESVLNDLWQSISGRNDTFDAEETAARREVLEGGFAGQLSGCADMFAALAQEDITTRDMTAESFRRALVAFISALRRYRSYATGLPDPALLDQAVLNAVCSAKETVPADAASVEFIVAVLNGEVSGPALLSQSSVRRLNQLTAPVAAKAVEDTAFYRYSRLLSRNDVGFDVNTFAMSPAAFLQSGVERAKYWPYGMLTTATHDHKRGEDVRARLAVLSEVPEAWSKTVRSWLEMTAAERPKEITDDDVYSLFQTIVGSWPIGLALDDLPALHSFADRIVQWREKSLREAKLRSSWTTPDTAYEHANRHWIEHLLISGESQSFLMSVAAFVGVILGVGAINSLVQAALRCTWPGVPDLYQGAELWDFSLVDPDNRRKVDYDTRARLLANGEADWTSGAVKEALIARLLKWRHADPALFTTAPLRPARVRGSRASHVLAFLRDGGDRTAHIAVMLHVASAGSRLGEWPNASWWDDTAVELGPEWTLASELFRNGPVFAEQSKGPATNTLRAIDDKRFVRSIS